MQRDLEAIETKKNTTLRNTGRTVKQTIQPAKQAIAENMDPELLSLQRELEAIQTKKNTTPRRNIKRAVGQKPVKKTINTFSTTTVTTQSR